MFSVQIQLSLSFLILVYCNKMDKTERRVMDFSSSGISTEEELLFKMKNSNSLTSWTTDFIHINKAIYSKSGNSICAFNITFKNGFVVLPVHSTSKKDCDYRNVSVVKSNIAEVNRLNFQKKPLRVAAVLSQEYAYDTGIIQKPDGTFSFQPSFAVEVLHCLEFTMNFTTVPVITDFWGHLLPNKSWTGVISLLLEDKADLGISSTADHPFRRVVIDYNIPTNTINVVAFFKKGSAFSSPMALLQPFQALFWLFVVLVIFLLVFSTATISKLLSSNTNPANFNVTVWEWDIVDCMQWSLSTISLKGFYKVPYQLPYKIVMIVGSLFGLVIYSSYSGTIISFLSVVVEPIQNFGQLLQADYTFLIVMEPLIRKYLSEATDTSVSTMYQRGRSDLTYYSLKDAKRDVVAGSFVFVCDDIGAYEHLNNEFSPEEACQIRVIEIPYAKETGRQGTVIPLKSPYKRIIDYQIIRMLQYGLVKRWTAMYMTKKPTCSNRREYQGVGITTVLLAFLLLIGGMFFGIFILVIEIQYHTRLLKYKSKQ